MIDKCIFCKTEVTPNLTVVSDAEYDICSDCIKSCYYLLEDNKKEQQKIEISKGLKTAKEIKAHLDKFVIGQENAKKVLSVGIVNHYKRVTINELNKNNFIRKSNILILGGTGTGKSYIIEKIAEYLDLPVAIVNSKQYTESGYVGNDVNIILRELYVKANNDINLTQKGIIYIDEIDKLRAKETTRAAADVGVQSCLLKMVESEKMEVPLKGSYISDARHNDNDKVTIDTTNILFIVGGAFSELAKGKQIELTKTPVGFFKEEKKPVKSNAYDEIKQKDLVNYGFLAEFIARFPIVAKMNDLTKDDIKNILLNSEESVLKQYQDLLKFDNKTLSFTDKDIDKISEKVIKLETGARGIRSIFDEILIDKMYEIEDNKEEEIRLKCK